MTFNNCFQYTLAPLDRCQGLVRACSQLMRDQANNDNGGRPDSAVAVRDLGWGGEEVNEESMRSFPPPLSPHPALKISLFAVVAEFKVTLPCSGLMSAEVDIRMQMNINIFSASNLTVLNFKRRKICLKGRSCAIFLRVLNIFHSS